jgi:hypothetical protein
VFCHDRQFGRLGGDAKALEGAEALAELKTVSQTAMQKRGYLPGNESLDVANIIPLRQRNTQVVREVKI